jgi:hypothetical protein
LQALDRSAVAASFEEHAGMSRGYMPLEMFGRAVRNVMGSISAPAQPAPSLHNVDHVAPAGADPPSSQQSLEGHDQLLEHDSAALVPLRPSASADQDQVPPSRPGQHTSEEIEEQQQQEQQQLSDDEGDGAITSTKRARHVKGELLEPDKRKAHFDRKFNPALSKV